MNNKYPYTYTIKKRTHRMLLAIFRGTKIVKLKLNGSMLQYLLNLCYSHSKCVSRFRCCCSMRFSSCMYLIHWSGIPNSVGRTYQDCDQSSVMLWEPVINSAYTHYVINEWKLYSQETKGNS